jgi:hypothetical protein
MPKTFRPWNPEQMTLLPPSPSDWLEKDQQVYFRWRPFEWCNSGGPVTLSGE